MNTTLAELQPGQTARVVAVAGRSALNRRILDMGLTPGTLIHVERAAPLGDPIDIKLKGYHLSLRKEEAATITVDSSFTLHDQGSVHLSFFRR